MHVYVCMFMYADLLSLMEASAHGMYLHYALTPLPCTPMRWPDFLYGSVGAFLLACTIIMG